MNTRIDWPALMHAGFGVLRLSPSAFWAMTPREFAAATGPLCQAAPMERSALDALLARFPDQEPS